MTIFLATECHIHTVWVKLFISSVHFTILLLFFHVFVP